MNPLATWTTDRFYCGTGYQIRDSGGGFAPFPIGGETEDVQVEVRSDHEKSVEMGKGLNHFFYLFCIFNGANEGLWFERVAKPIG